MKLEEVRRVRRIRINMRAIAVCGGATFPAQVADISVNGCRIVARGMPDLAGALSLELEDAGLRVDCEVVWQRGLSAGLRFVVRGTPDVGRAGETTMLSTQDASERLAALARAGRSGR